jgi:3-oxoacyl-[acyl-carrier protein] reductase
MEKLAGRTALVTGSGRGIGRSIALKLASEGARVVVNDLDAEPADEVVAAITAAGGTAVACVGSVTDRSFPERFVGMAVEAFGGVDIIVNNAGYTWDSVVQRMTDDAWDAMLAVHLSAPFRVLREALPVIREASRREAEQGAVTCRKIVNVSSVAGTRGHAGQVNYSAAKAGVLGLTKSLAREWGRYNVTVNSVAFGFINTRLTEPPAVAGTVHVDGHEVSVGIAEPLRDGARATAALGRHGTPEEAAGAVYLLCIPESDFITGETLICSGGL